MNAQWVPIIAQLMVPQNAPIQSDRMNANVWQDILVTDSTAQVYFPH